MDVQLLTQADFVLNKCGRPVAPTGSSHVYIPHSIPVLQVFPSGATTLSQQITKTVVGDTTWCLRGLSMTTTDTTGAPVSIKWNVMLPKGRFLLNDYQDVLQVGGYGSYRYTFTRELRCEAGTTIQCTFTDQNNSVVQPIAVLFEGAFDYLVRSSNPRICPTNEIAATMPRIFGGTNQNIMAPPWMTGVGPKTPAGYRDDVFTYNSQPVSLDAANGPFTGIQQIPIDSSSNFRCRRVLVKISADNTVTAGTILARLRLGSGYALCDDYFDIARYIGSVRMPKDWDLPAGDSVFVDLQLVDQTGTGNITIQTYLDGVKRRAVAA